MTVSRSYYYEWLDSPKTEREKKNEALIEILKVLFEKGRGTYGTRRLKKTRRPRCGCESSTYRPTDEASWVVM